MLNIKIVRICQEQPVQDLCKTVGSRNKQL